MAKKKKRKKKTIFWKIYKLIICIFLVLIVAGLGVLWHSLSKYEKNQQAEKALKEAEAPKQEEEVIPEEKDDIDTEFDEEKMGIAVVAPSTYRVTVDGVGLDSSKIIQTEQLKQAEIFIDYIPEGSVFPSMVAYYTENAMEFSRVECFDEFGQPVTADTDENNFYQYSFLEKNMTPDQFNYFDTLVTRYVKYCLNEGEQSDLLGYFIKGTETYQNICKIEDVKEYSGRKSGYEIGSISVNHFNQYAPNLYRVEIAFNYTVRNGKTSRENPTTLDCYIVDIDGEWKILEMDISSK